MNYEERLEMLPVADGGVWFQASLNADVFLF